MADLTVDDLSVELDLLLTEGAAFTRDDIRDSAARIVSAVVESENRLGVETALREELERIDISTVAENTAGVVVASMMLAYAHKDNKAKGSWTSPSAFVDNSWRDLAKLTDPDWKKIKSEAKSKAVVNISHAILTLAQSIMTTADRIEKEAKKLKIPFTKIWQTATGIDNMLKKNGFAETGQRPQQIVDSLANEGYGAKSYQLQAASGGFIGYVTMDDGRVRPNHKKLHMKAWPSSDVVWSTVYPPNGLKCRCRGRWFASKGEAKSAGFTIENGGVPKGGLPDPGFGTNPAEQPFLPNFQPIPRWMIKALDFTDYVIHTTI